MGSLLWTCCALPLLVMQPVFTIFRGSAGKANPSRFVNLDYRAGRGEVVMYYFLHTCRTPEEVGVLHQGDEGKL